MKATMLPSWPPPEEQTNPIRVESKSRPGFCRSVIRTDPGVVVLSEQSLQYK